MHAIHTVSWGRVIITLLLPLLASIWMMFVIRYKSIRQPVSSKYSVAAILVYGIIGFVVSAFLATYFGLYLTAQLTTGQMVSQALASEANFVTKVGLYISGLWGALFPYRLLAREGKRQVWIWLAIALVYAFVFFIFTFMVR